MKSLFKYVRGKPLSLLILALPLAVVAEVAHWGEVMVFVFAALGVIPMAGYIGESTEVLAHHTGPRLGGLLNATLGNAAELIITIVAIRQNLLDLVKASITGSILGNLLLVLGMAMLLGGVRNGSQRFDRRHASNNSVLLVLAVLTLLVPSLLSHYMEIGVEASTAAFKVEALSLGVAGVMIILYVLGLIYSLKNVGRAGSEGENHNGKKDGHGPAAPLTPEAKQLKALPGPGWTLKTALIVLGLSTVAVAFLSEILVGAVDPVVERLGVSEFFIGVIFIPIIGNVAEHMVAVQVAIRNQMTLSVEIAVASSLQIALFVAPVLVFISLVMGNPLTLIFNQFELLALVAGVLIAALVSFDGESNWLEGVELLAIYVILGLAFFLLPGATH